MTLPLRIAETPQPEVSEPAPGSVVIQQHVPQFSVIIVSGALFAAGTSSAEPARLWEAPYVPEPEATGSGFTGDTGIDAVADAEATRQVICELRRISGLTWDQLGELFGVSRRSVHFWASGKPLNAGNEQRLMQVLGVIQGANCGDARSTRAALFGAKEGTTAFGLLTAGRFEEARALLGAGAARPRSGLVELSAAAKAARKPLPPQDLVDAQHGRVHRDRGRGRSARTVRNKRRGTP